MIFDSLGASFIYGFLLRRGKISGIADIDIKMPIFFILGFGLEFGVLNLTDKYPIIMTYRAYIHFLDYLMLFIGLWYNRHNKYMRIIAIGIILNFIVIFANGGRMPVSIDSLKAAGIGYLVPELTKNIIPTHQAMTSSTKLKFLCDVLYLPKPYPLPKTFSVGDLFIATGIFLMVSNAMINASKRVKI
ncbi:MULTISPECIES: DUF5317 domain-containing protein [Thermoanaerobacterium]|uniref:DUF5317 domain-containing protein n=2 Tax=Thermoanaerobacterium TaxID=28895 RepID=W9E9N5_9THEO|nr:MULTISPECIES: DUF5317 domain-containing protein [Thermoanaerobacterium]AFK87645.1 hypothetical protein Tsac_2649 [Thermoanaerobacterium saccharolyticum JW/SL-YS485]ETO37580.1 hypothetical protein V518_2272 [Thermoanaerobacterium aotearoense SCUT27]